MPTVETKKCFLSIFRISVVLILLYPRDLNVLRVSISMICGHVWI